MKRALLVVASLTLMTVLFELSNIVVLLEASGPQYDSDSGVVVALESMQLIATKSEPFASSMTLQGLRTSSVLPDRVIVADTYNCTENPSTAFLYLPFVHHTTTEDDGPGDWMELMTSAFDHHYPDYTCSFGDQTNCANRGREIVLWEGETAYPVNGGEGDRDYSDDYCYKIGDVGQLTHEEVVTYGV